MAEVVGGRSKIAFLGFYLDLKIWNHGNDINNDEGYWDVLPVLSNWVGYNPYT